MRSTAFSILGISIKIEMSQAFVAALCVLALTNAGSAQQARTSRSDQSSIAIAKARSSLAAGDPETAIQILARQVQSHPDDISSRLLLAQACEAAQESDQAETQYETVLTSAPENYLALAGLGELYEKAGNLEKAEPLLAHAAKASHGSAQIRTAWATVLARLHRYDDASRALAGVPVPSSTAERISFYRLNASIAAGRGEATAAAADMEKALALAPEQTGLQAATAAAELQAKHWQRASGLAHPLFSRIGDPSLGLLLLEAQLGAGEEIHPTLDALRSVNLSENQECQFRQRLAELLIEHDRFKEAAAELKRAAELDPTRADLNFNLALAEYKAGELDDALVTAQSLQKAADNAEVEDLIGDIEELRGDNLAAVHSYEAAVALAPDEEKYSLSLAVEFIRHKSFEPARVVLKQAEALHPDSWRVQLALGMVEYFSGSTANATQTLLKAAAVAPDPEPALSYLGDIQIDETGSPDPAALTHLCAYGDAHSQAGRIQLDCAALLFRKAYAANDRSQAEEIIHRLNTTMKELPRDASPHCQLGRAYRWLNRWQDALRESEACARMDPDSADAHYRLAQIYQHLGDKQQFEKEMTSYSAASAHVAGENARRDETIKTFVYTIEKR